MRFAALTCGLLTATGCGRLDFAEAPPAPPAGFLCNTPQRFQTPGADITKLMTVNTKSGQQVVMTDAAGNLSMWAFERDDETLIPIAENIALDVDVTTTIAATAFDDLVVVSAITGKASPNGTRLYPRDAGGSARAAAISHPELSADRAVATSPSGQFAFANIDATSGDLQLRRIDALGAYRDAPVTVVPGAQSTNFATLSAGGPGYLLQWSAAVSSPSSLTIALLDDSFDVVAGPVVANTTTTHSPIRPRVAWASESDTYLVIWFEKNGSTDDTWYQLRDANLQPLTVAGVLQSDTSSPEVTSDGTDFWVTWKAGTALQSARISSTGVVTPRVVETSGGTPKAWSMLRSGEQPVLAWVEGGGSGPDLWFDPMCP